MARVYYEPLDEESAKSLAVETSRRRSHTGMILIFESGGLATPEGGVDFARIRELVASRLPELPRLRSKLRWVPIEGHPIWVDDGEFDLDYHLRHSALPKPGSRDQLSKTISRIGASRLDRSRPLWECWVLEGLEGGRFALVYKIHQALDREEGADLLRAILSESGERAEVVPPRLSARPAPAPVELFLNEIVRDWNPSKRALRQVLGVIRHPRRASDGVQERARGLLKVLGYRLRHPSRSPFDGNLGPHRAFALHALDLETVKQVRQALGGSIHDCVLTILTGALRRYLEDRRISPVTLDLRAVAPVLEADGSSARPWTIELPIWEATPAARHERVHEQTRRLRTQTDAAPGETLVAGHDWTTSRRFALGARAIGTLEGGQLAILQSPGPQQALHLDGARLEECYGILPLRDGSGLNATVVGYAGGLFVMFNGDPDLGIDVRQISDALGAELAELAQTGASAAGRGRFLRAVGAGAGSAA
ncbi:WS/DGAT domain-containing protein [Myxococcota bacterium]|nr:WS/DGAT domain-containing protein [Myxococcota bacterium]